jgi:broad specificity phosphatase PhoE
MGPARVVGPVSAELWLVRHGETEWTCAGRLCGRSDPPLTERGRAAARELRSALADRRFDRVVSSPSARALETARLAYGEPETDDRLVELDFGELERTTWAECTDDVRRSLVDYSGFCAPGGESVEQLGERTLAALRDLGPGTHLVVTHGGVIRFLLGLASETAYPQPASLTKMKVGWSPGIEASIMR